MVGQEALLHINNRSRVKFLCGHEIFFEKEVEIPDLYIVMCGCEINILNIKIV